MKNLKNQFVAKVVFVAVAAVILLFAAASVRVLAVTPLDGPIAIERYAYVSGETRVQALAPAPTVIGIIYDADLHFCCCLMQQIVWAPSENGKAWTFRWYLPFSHNHPAWFQCIVTGSLGWDFMTAFNVAIPMDECGRFVFPYSIINPSHSAWNNPLNPQSVFTGYLRDMISGAYYHWTESVPIDIGQHRVFGLVWRDLYFSFCANEGYFRTPTWWGGYQYSPNMLFPVGQSRLYDRPISQTQNFWQIPGVPVRDGYVFEGWQEDATGLIFTHSEMGNLYTWQFPWFENNWTRSFTAVWRSPVNLTFNANGGTPETQTQVRGAGSQIGTLLPPPPTREGFVFAGWFNTPAATGGTQLTATSIVPNTDTTFWARWHVVLTFNGNGGTPATQTLTRPPGSVINWNSLPPATPPGPIRPGYVFAGWYTTPSGTDGTRLTGMTIVPNAPTTYWARWKILTIYYENLVSANTQAALNHADDSVNAIKHLFLTNFGVNLVQRNPARHEPGLSPSISASSMLNVSQSTHNTMRFRFAHFGIGVAGLARPGFGWNGHTNFHLGDMIVTTTLDPVSVRFTVVHEISHLLGSLECETGAGSGCVMSAATPRANYSHWCDLCRTRMHSYLGRLWIGHLSHFAPSGASQEFQPFADEPDYAIYTEAVYFYTPY